METKIHENTEAAGAPSMGAIEDAGADVDAASERKLGASENTGASEDAGEGASSANAAALELETCLRRYISDGTSEAVFNRYLQLPAHAARTDFGELDENIVVVDTETTGFSLNHDELIQIAAARMERGEITDWYVTFVNPGKPIPGDIVHLTGICDADVADAPTPTEALAGLVKFVGNAKLVAHNAEFDRNFTTNHPSGYPLLENIWIDSLDLARIALPRMKSHRLLDLVRAFALPPSTHRADADVAATCGLFRILLAAIDTMPDELVREIALMATVEQWPTVAVFSFFAARAARTNSTKKVSENSPDVTASSHSSFSLRALRRNRLGKKEERAKVDADAIAKDPMRELVFPASTEIADAFDACGLLGDIYPNFEPRHEQAVMSEAVRNAFATSENLVVEAGTGVGKSMAYLVPCALTARANNISVGIATKTNALLDQLVYHELPALSEALGGEVATPSAPAKPLTYAPLKGFSHYPCLRRIEGIVKGGAQMREVYGKQYSQAPALAALLSFIEQTDYDDIDGLKIDYRVLPRRSITTTSHDCLRRKCPYFGQYCFVHGARRRAESADIIVTNHSLLFCDLAADGGLLPPVRYWIVDEAHGAETEARRAFSLSLEADKIERLAQRVGSSEHTRNVFARAEAIVAQGQKDENATLFYALSAKAKSAGEAFSREAVEFASHIKDLLFFETNKRSKGYDQVELWINNEIRHSETFQGIVAPAHIMCESAEKLISASQEIVGYLEEVSGAAEVQREIACIVLELKDMIGAAEIILDKAPQDYVYSATLNRKKDSKADAMQAALVNVGEHLNETLYAHTHSVVYTSATMTVNDSFEAFERAVGLNEGENSQCRECQLDSSYDYDANMTIYVASDMPEPNEAGYLSALQNLLIGAHLAQEGSMLTLFTNRREMEKCFDVVQPALKDADLRLVCQKWGVSIKGLRDDFLADEHLSLFALKSFWEGFDAPGATLKGVIIPKLPFSKPSDPLSCERSQRDEAAWRHYVLPQAVLETKQAAGRLIRKASDAGVLILADRRLVTKGYGKTVLNSMPSKTIKICTAAEIVEELKQRR